jgi:DNA processing protein
VPRTVVVLRGGAARPYPRSARALHARVLATGAAISELPPGVGVRRWMFAARNRIIAALAAMTVVVEADERSGALITAAWAGELGRPRGAVPGRVTSPQAAGPNQLLAGGATLVRGPQDVLDELFGAGVREAAQSAPRVALDDRHQTLLHAFGDGYETAEALARGGFTAGEGLAALSSLELSGYLRREPGGRYTVVP